MNLLKIFHIHFLVQLFINKSSRETEPFFLKARVTEKNKKKAHNSFGQSLNGHMGRDWTWKKPRTRNPSHSTWAQVSKYLNFLLLPAQVHLKQAASAVEQWGYKCTAIWGSSTTGSSLTCRISTLSTELMLAIDGQWKFPEHDVDKLKCQKWTEWTASY